MIAWGPFAVRMDIMAAIAAVAAALIVIRLLARKTGSAGAEAAGWIQNAVLIGFLVWKFGHAVFAPSIVWERPLALLIMHGGSREAAIAVTAATIYVALKLRQGQTGARLVLDLASVGAIAAMFAYVWFAWTYGKETTVPWGIVLSDPDFRYHPVSVYKALVACVVGLLIAIRRAPAGSGEWFRIAATYTGIGLLLVSFWEIGNSVFWGLSSLQWQALMLTAVGMFYSLPAHTSREGR